LKRTYSISPEAIERLAGFDATEDEFHAISLSASDLARDPTLGYRIPFEVFDNSGLFGYSVGRFNLIYRYDKNMLDVVTISL
jgi:hypothetical protein